MKILEFTLPVNNSRSIITKEERLKHFYPHLHRHSEVQLTWVISGEGTLVAGNAIHNFHGNEIYWIGANQAHVFKSDPSYFSSSNEKTTHSIDIFFNIDAQLSPFFSMPEIRQLKNFVELHRQGFRIPPAKVASLSRKMRLIRDSDGIEQFIHFMDLLRSISSLENLASLSPESTPIKCSDSEGLRIASVYNYVMQNYKKPISLDQVSKMAYMSPQAFCRYFKKHTHHTLVTFINHVRINEACKQLVENERDSIACIAYNTGFNSITNFNRVFKSVVKKSPKQFVESYLRQVS